MGLGPTRLAGGGAIAPSQGGTVGPAGSMAPSQGGTVGPAGSFVNAEGQIVDASGSVMTDLTGGLGSLNFGATQEELNAAASPYAGALQEQFTGQDVYSDPSYQFRMEEGMKALRAQQAAGGNRFGGQAMKDITNYAQGAASQEYGNAYNRFYQQKQSLYDRLAGLSGGAATAAGQMGTAGTAASEQMGRTLVGSTESANAARMGGANATAAGTIGSTNAIVGGINQGASNWLFQDALRRSPPPPGGG